MPNVEDVINLLTEARTPHDEPMTSVSVKIPRERSHQLKALAKEVGMKYPQLVAVVFDDGCSRLLRAESKLPSTVPDTPPTGRNP